MSHLRKKSVIVRDLKRMIMHEISVLNFIFIRKDFNDVGIRYFIWFGFTLSQKGASDYFGK